MEGVQAVICIQQWHKPAAMAMAMVACNLRASVVLLHRGSAASTTVGHINTLPVICLGCAVHAADWLAAHVGWSPLCLLCLVTPLQQSTLSCNTYPSLHVVPMGTYFLLTLSPLSVCTPCFALLLKHAPRV